MTGRGHDRIGYLHKFIDEDLKSKGRARYKRYIKRLIRRTAKKRCAARMRCTEE